MRFYPTEDVFFYVDINDGWDRYCTLPDKKRYWKPKTKYVYNVISYWRDLEGAKKPEILMKDLYFDDWDPNRLKPGVCLPFYYCTGNRFIKLSRAPPAGFKCAPMPISLIEARKVKEKIKAEEKAAKAAKKASKKGKGKKGKKGKK